MVIDTMGLLEERRMKRDLETLTSSSFCKGEKEGDEEVEKRVIKNLRGLLGNGFPG